MKPSRFVIIGAGAAGSHAALHLRERLPLAAITLFSSEPYGFYHKFNLHRFLSGAVKKEDLFYLTHDQFGKLNIHLRLNQPVVAVEPARQRVVLDHGESVDYDKLLLATGVRPFIPPAFRRFASYLTLFGGLADAEKLLHRPERLKLPLVIGGGLTAVKLADALKTRIGSVDYVLHKALTADGLLDEKDYQTLISFLADKGIRFWDYHDVCPEFIQLVCDVRLKRRSCRKQSDYRSNTYHHPDNQEHHLALASSEIV